jgi:coenzyme F420-0:L-glutamate ligase / coenzyme F420-1:gamma-L-glutamate ligase
MSSSLELFAIDGIPAVAEGDRIGQLILSASPSLMDGDVVVVASKVVAKAEGRVVECTDEAEWNDLVAQHSTRVLRRRGPLAITETPHGFVCANSGIDKSNVESGHVVLLPKDPDRSAHVIRNELRGIGGIDAAVIVSDTHGRPWRTGAVDVAIGCAGLPAIRDLRGESDGFGNRLESTEICLADQLAAASGLLMTKAGLTPVVVIRGLDYESNSKSAIGKDVVRNYQSDMFR